MAQVDVEKVMNDLAAKNKERLDWRRSIVDLMKLLNLDSSLSARKELAKELGYTGDTNDSATMNIWLHKQVMQKLAANGGKVPADLVKH
jgi:HEAT repeat protein